MRAKPRTSDRRPDGQQRAQIMFRPLQSQLDRIDDRAESLGMSRNLWIERALEDALTRVAGQPPSTPRPGGPGVPQPMVPPKPTTPQPTPMARERRAVPKPSKQKSR